MVSNDDHANKAPALLAVIWTLAALSTIVLAARLYTRASIVRRVALDDYLMVLSWCCNDLFAIFLTISTHYGLGRHMFALDPYHARMAMRWDFTAQAWGVFTPMFGRISFSVTLLNLVGTSKVKKQLIYFFIVVQVLAGVSTVILIYVQCGTKIEALWDPTVRATAHCWSPNVQTYYGFFQSSVNSVTDLFLTIMPAWILWNVQMKRPFKVALSCLLGLSVFAMFASIVKTYELSNLGRRNDFTWNTPIFFIWTVVELNIVIIAASIPALKPLFGNKKASTRGQSYEMYGSTLRNNRSGRYGMQSEHQAWATPSRTKGSVSHKTDGSSEENILPMQHPHAITKTTDVTVTSYTGDENKANMRMEKLSGDEEHPPFPFAHPEDRV